MLRVFLQLDIKSLARCDRVCKRWRKSQTLNYSKHSLPRYSSSYISTHSFFFCISLVPSHPVVHLAPTQERPRRQLHQSPIRRLGGLRSVRQSPLADDVQDPGPGVYDPSVVKARIQAGLASHLQGPDHPEREPIVCSRLPGGCRRALFRARYTTRRARDGVRREQPTGEWSLDAEEQEGDEGSLQVASRAKEQGERKSRWNSERS
jgi:hypothetical protein